MSSHRKNSSAYESKKNEYTCEFCGKTWFGHKKRFCSYDCRQRSYGRHIYTDAENTCVICGNLIHQKKGKHAITCPGECREEYKRKRDRSKSNASSNERHRIQYKENHPGSRKIGDTYKCSWCGKDYILKCGIRYTCSKECKNALYKANHKTEPIIKECAICGEPFTVKSSNHKYCSSDCSRQAMYAAKPKRITAENLVDRNITIKNLYKRDGGKCYICGCDCSYDDRNEKSCFGRYPTIEHVIPLSHGGKHSWENVRLACWSCNMKKSDTVPDNVFPAPRYIGKPKQEPKRTLQYTKDGVLVGDFVSTGEAERQTGFSSKQLQKCCRGECKSYKGFVWKYA